MEECENRIRKYDSRNRQLESIFESHRSNIADLERLNQESRRELLQLQQENREAWLLSREEIISSQEAWRLKIKDSEQKANFLQEELTRREKKYEVINNHFNATLK